MAIGSDKAVVMGELVDEEVCDGLGVGVVDGEVEDVPLSASGSEGVARVEKLF